MRKGILTIWMVWVFLLSYALFNHTLQVFAHPVGNVNSGVLSPDWSWLLLGVQVSRSDLLYSGEFETARAPGDRLIPGAGVSHLQAVKAGSPEMNTLTETDSRATVERKVRDAQLTIRATGLSGNILVEDDEFCVPPGEAVAWEVELSVYNMRASTGWRYWNAALEFGSGLTVEAVDSPGTIDPIPEGGSPTEPALVIGRDQDTQKTKVVWSWHSFEDDTSSDFPKRARAAIRLKVCSSPESGHEPGNFIFCDNARITYVTGAKRPKEATYELSPIVVNVTSL